MACIALHNLCIETSDPCQPRWILEVDDLDLIRKRLRRVEDKRESNLNRLKISNWLWMDHWLNFVTNYANWKYSTKIRVQQYLWKNSQSMDPSRYVSVVFSYFCREWHLRKFLILGDLSRHLFGLISPCPTSEKMRVGVHQMPAPPPPLPQ